MTKTNSSSAASTAAIAAALEATAAADTAGATAASVAGPDIAPAGEARILGGGAEALRATAEQVEVSRDDRGEPRSASIEPRPATLDETFGLPRRPRATRAVPDLVATSLPATTRVLPSGLEIPAHPRAADAGEERLFTAASKILRDKVLYDIGAPVPLTRAEFLSKRQLGAVSEEDFADGEDMPEVAFPDGLQPV